MEALSHVRVRFAPSPTGHLHVGGARSALFNWLFARHNNGTYVVRIEDTDVQRSTKEYLESQLSSLRWLGLLPDEPLVYQMSRIAEHHKAAQELLDKKLAYRCFCEPRSADDVVQSLEQGIGTKYDGTCRDKIYTDADLVKPHAIRFKIPRDIEIVTFQDQIVGTVSVSTDQLDDYIIVRRDGTPIYNFCVVVDDIFMKITHVIRGQDHISNTPKQILLYKAFAVQEPLFAHIPLILGPSGSKLSKRDAAVSVEEYRSQGYLADALSNYLVRLGWSHGDQEVFTKVEMINYFSFDHIGKKGSIFDIKKLQWLNGTYLRAMQASDLLQNIGVIDPVYEQDLRGLWQERQLGDLIDLYKQRAVTLLDLYHSLVSFAQKPESYDLALITKWHTEKTKTMMASFDKHLEQVTAMNHDDLAKSAQDICLQHETKLVDIAQPLRLALTGGIVSPGVFELIILLGKNKTRERINAFMSHL